MRDSHIGVGVYGIYRRKTYKLLHLEKKKTHTAKHIPIKYPQTQNHLRKSAICICEKKGADQLRGNRTADQRHCVRYTDSTIPLPPTSKISSLKSSSMAGTPIRAILVGNPRRQLLLVMRYKKFYSIK